MAGQGQDISSMKMSMTLDLNSGMSKGKRFKNTYSSPGAVLTSPDLSMFKLASPEVERFIKGGLAANSQQATPMNTYLFPKNVTSEQKDFVKGFEDALNHIKERSSIEVSAVVCEAPRGMGTTTLTTLTTLSNVNNLGSNSNASTVSSDALSSDCTNDSLILKDEQTVPSSMDSATPIDMRDQEKLKLERKRLRNRIAASKCRKKKLERIAVLETQVSKLKNQNQEYEKMIRMLRTEVDTLRQEVVMHQHGGCHIE